MRRLVLVLALVAALAAPAAAQQFVTSVPMVTAFDLTATSYTYYDKDGVGGTAITDGWVSLSNAETFQASVAWNTKAATSLEYQLECRQGPSGSKIVVATRSLTSATAEVWPVSYHAWNECRVGLKLTTDTGVNSVTAAFNLAIGGSGTRGLSSAGGTLTGPLLLPDGTAAAPSLAFASTPTGGWFNTSGGWTFSAAGTRYLFMNTTGYMMKDNGQLSWSTNPTQIAADLFLSRDAANTLGLRNGGTVGTPVPQTFNVYNFCDGAACATGHERARLAWASNILYLQTENAGTGSGRAIEISGPVSVTVRTQAGGGTTTSGGGIYPVTDDTYLGTANYSWGSIYTRRGLQGSKNKVLTDAAAAVSFVRIAVPTNGFAAGSVGYTATSTDGTNILVTKGSCEWAAADTAGTVTAGTPACTTPATAYKRANTLVCTITGAVSTTNYDLQATCTDNLAGNQTMSINWRLDMEQPNTVTPQ